MEIAEAAVSCIGLVQFLGKVVFFVMEIKDTPGDIREKQDKVANCSQRLIQLLESPLLEKHQKNTLVSRSRGYKDSLHQLQDLLKPVCPNSRQGSASLLWHSIKARVNKEDIKNAFDRVLQAQKEVDSCILELNLHQGAQTIKSLHIVKEGQTEITERQKRGETLAVGTLASTARIEDGIDHIKGVTVEVHETSKLTVEELREVKFDLRQLRQQIKEQQLYNQTALEGNKQATIAVNQTILINAGTAVTLPSRTNTLQIRHRSLSEKSCACVPSMKRQAMLQNRFVAEFFTEHSRDCPYYEGGLKRWSYCAFPPWWSYSLLPILRRKLVTVGWVQSSVAGTDCISPILQTWRRVSRSESSVFTALDDFKNSVDWVDEFSAFTGFVPHGFGEAPRERVPDDFHVKHLEECIVVIESAFRRGRAFPTDVDETGKSAWQTVLELGQLALRGHHDKLLPSLVGLLVMLLDHGVRPDREHYGPGALTLKSLWDVAIARANTAFALGRTPSFEHFTLPGYQELEQAGFVEERGRTDSFLASPSFIWRSIAQRHPELLIDLGLPAISEQLLLTPTLDQFKSNTSHEKIRIWDQSNSWDSKRTVLGWTEAIEYLAEAGCGFRGALKDACSQNDIEIVHALLHTGTLSIETSDLDAAFRASNMEILVAVVKELVARRHTPDSQHFITAVGNGLNGRAHHQAVSLFSNYEFIDPLGFGPGYTQRIQCLLDAGFHGLEKPGANGETVLYRTCRLYSPLDSNQEQDFMWLLSNSNEDKLRWQHGFDEDQLTGPIFYVASFLRHIDVAALKDAGILQPLKTIPTDDCDCFCSTGGCMPHYMFLRCDGNGCRYGQTFDACTAERYGITARDSPLRQWCDAWRLPWRYTEQYYQEACRLEIFERLGMQHTCCAAGRRDDYSRLIPGTIATLHASLGAPDGEEYLAFKNKWRRPDEAERSEIQSDDATWARQLNLIMDFYSLARIKFRSMPVIPDAEDDYDRSFWVSWWRTIDRFLPPIGREKCVYRGLNVITRDMYQSNRVFQALDKAYPEKRQMEELAALRLAGSGKKDFDRVISEHLSRFCRSPFPTCPSNTPEGIELDPYDGER